MLEKNEVKEATVEEQLRAAEVFKKIGWGLIALAMILVLVTFVLNARKHKAMATVVEINTGNTDRFGVKVGEERNLSVTDVTRIGQFNSSKKTKVRLKLETVQPVFEYVDSQGKKHRSPYYTFESGLNFQIGDKVEIGYDPNDFSSVRIVSWSKNLNIPIYLILFGFFIMWIAQIMKKQVYKTQVNNDSLN